MCQAIPRRVLQRDGRRVQVDYDGKPTWVEAGALGELAIGDYVAVYAGQALDRLDPGEAEAMLAFYADLERMLEEASS